MSNVLTLHCWPGETPSPTTHHNQPSLVMYDSTPRPIKTFDFLTLYDLINVVSYKDIILLWVEREHNGVDCDLETTEYCELYFAIHGASE